MRSLIDIIKETTEQEEYEKANTREKHIEGLIRFAFEKIGLEINYNNFSVHYEDATRMAEVRLEEQIGGISLTTLNRLNETGLSESYALEAGSDGIVVIFQVSRELDDAVAGS